MADLKARIDALDLAALQSFIADAQEENLHLDFKTIAGAQLKTADDRKNLAKALSGFANSDGGIIIWGVDARKGPDDVDCAQGLAPIGNVVALVSRLNQLTSDMVTPVVDGVIHRIVHQEPDGSGYAATLVPRSEAGPHMAKGREDRYFKRAGDSFIRLEHFDIADMFGRRPHPDLRLRLAARPTGERRAPHNTYQMYVVIGAIENIGRGSAAAPYLAIRTKSPGSIDRYGVDGNGNHGLPMLPARGLPGHDKSRRFGGSASVLLHPGTCLDVFAFSGEYDCGKRVATDLVIEYDLAAEGMPLRSDTVTLSGSDIVACVSGE